MLKIILIALSVIVVLFLGVVVIQPSDFQVTRTATISAPAPEVFAQVNDFHKWEAWNPWAKIDPAMKQTYQGAPSGTGAVYTWTGNNEVGEGRMTITESRPSDLIRIKLEFFKPFAATNTAEFTFKPEGDQTAVTWSMDRQEQFHGQGSPPGHGHGQNGRRSIRKRSCANEIGVRSSEQRLGPRYDALQT